MKPTFSVHFSLRQPDRAGLWLVRRNNFISVMEVQQSDLIRAQKDMTWLDGEWGAELKLVERDQVTLEPKSVEGYLDKAILAWFEKRQQTVAEIDKLKRTPGLREGEDQDIMAKIDEAQENIMLSDLRIECLQLVRQSLLGKLLVLPEHDTEKTPQN